MESNRPKLTKFEMHIIMNMLRAGESDWLNIYREIQEIRNGQAEQKALEKS